MMAMVFCRGCGKEIHETAPTCPHCGAPQRLGYPGKNKAVAGVLAILLGGLGIHRFYLGQWWGIFYLLFCWTLIPSLVAFIEGIVFLVTDDATWNAKYGKA
jgi:TM2 domain-containing membrane protein YozV